MNKLEWALWLASRGFRVFPLIPGGKKPAIDSFPIAATTDPETIRLWWSQRPDCNIGVCTTNFVVVDIDTKKGRDGAEWYELIGGHYDTFTVETASGGKHCYFAGPDSMLAVGIMPGIDIRSHHGYVVAPGSTTSKQYEDCVDGAYTIVNNAPLAEVPEGIKGFLRPPIHRQRSDDIELDKESSITHAAMWMQNAEPAISGQGGNDHTYRIAAKVVRDFALSPETAYSQMLAHWNHRCIPPWSNEELWQIVLHAAEYGKGDAGAALPEKMFGGVKPIETPETPPPPAAADMGVRMGNAVDPHNLTPRPWRVEKLLMNGDVTVLGGMGAIGKSMLEIVLAAHFSLGLDFGTYKLRIPDRPLRSIIYNAEDDTMEQSRRLYATCVQYGLNYLDVRRNIAFMDDRSMRLCVATMQSGMVKADKDSMKFIIDTAQQEHADILIFDPLLNLHRCDENSNNQMLEVMNIMRHIARVTNSAVMLAQHTSKGSVKADKGDQDVLRGASAIVNSARVGVVMSALDVNDTSKYGILSSERRDYSRLDNAKTNLFKPTGEAQALLKWETVSLPTKDYIGVPRLVDFKENIVQANMEILSAVRDAIIMEGSGGISVDRAAKHLMQYCPIFAKVTTPTMPARVITQALEKPVRVDDDILSFGLVNGKRVIQISKNV